MQSLETKSSRPKAFETETRPSKPRLQKRVSRRVSRPSLETPSLVNLLAFYHFLQLVSRNSGKRSLTSGLAWGPRMPEQRYGKRAVNELRAIETYKNTKKFLPIMLAFVKQQC